ncbi:MAG: hypothetical protein ACJAZ8_002222 [Planctomycetota bacterium]|jgi:hypothetical protein
MKINYPLSLLALSSISLLACQATDEGVQPMAVEAMEQELVMEDPFAGAADEMWQTCVVCHGEQGLGDGIAAPALGVVLQSFGDPAWNAATSDETLGAILVDGGAAHGKSALMPGNPQLLDSPGLLKSMILKVRSFGQAGH